MVFLARRNGSGSPSSLAGRSRFFSVAITLCLAVIGAQLNMSPASAVLPNMVTAIVDDAISAGQTTSTVTFKARASGLSVPASGYLDFSITPTTGQYTGTLPQLFGLSGYSGTAIASDMSSGSAVKIRYTFSAAWAPSMAQAFISIPAGSISFTGSGPGVFQVEVFDSAGVAQNNVVTTSVNYSQRVTFNANDGSGATTTQVSSTAAGLTYNTFTRNGYVFNGWKTAANGSTVAYADGAQYPFSASITLYADWSPVYTLTFNANDGSGQPAETTQSGAGALGLNGNSFTRSGFTFAGWNTLAAGGGTAYNDFDSFTLSSNTTLYAVWLATAFTLTFDANDSSGSPAQTGQVGYGNIALNPNGFTRTGYTFAGWDTIAAGGGTTYVDSFGTYSLLADGILYAQWTLTPAVVAPTASVAATHASIERTGNRFFVFGAEKIFTIGGKRLAGLQSVSYLNGAAKIISDDEFEIKVDLGNMPIGSHDLVLMFNTGKLIFQEAVIVADPAVLAAAAANRLPKLASKKVVIKKSVAKKVVTKKKK